MEDKNATCNEEQSPKIAEVKLRSSILIFIVYKYISIERSLKKERGLFL